MSSDPAITPSALRIGDAERDRAAESLGEHLRAGRLDVAEYDERLERAMTARTASELVPLFADLPGGSPLGPHALVAPPPRPRSARRAPGPAFSTLPALIRVVAVLAFVGAVILFAAVVTFPPLLLIPLLWFAFGHRFGHRQYHHRGRYSHHPYIDHGYIDHGSRRARW